MPLNPSSLQSDLLDAYDTDNRNPSDAAQVYATAIINFWETALTPGAGSVNAQIARPTLVAALTNTYSLNRNSPTGAAQIVANALNSGLASVIASGGAYGVGPVTPLGLAALIPELINIYGSTTNNPSQTAQREAQAIFNFTKATLCTGTGVGSPPVPQIGPLS